MRWEPFGKGISLSRRTKRVRFPSGAPITEGIMWNHFIYEAYMNPDNYRAYSFSMGWVLFTW